MEHINKIEIQGVVGAVRTQALFGELVSNFSVATDTIYRNKQGDSIAETMWHNVVVWQSKTSTDLTKIEKGKSVRVVGRLRQTKYTDVHGEEKVFHEILANEFSIIDDD
jgi:single-strand DNA-binding protein